MGATNQVCVGMVDGLQHRFCGGVWRVLPQHDGPVWGVLLVDVLATGAHIVDSCFCWKVQVGRGKWSRL